MIKATAILITLTAIAKGFCDSIIFRPDEFPFRSDWWLGIGKYHWSNRTWLEETIFSFISDGWHLFDAIRIVSLLLIVSLLVVELYFKKLDLEPEPLTADRLNYNKSVAVVLTVVATYVYHGLIFTLTFWIL